jgi:hypothetical protein
MKKNKSGNGKKRRIRAPDGCSEFPPYRNEMGKFGGRKNRSRGNYALHNTKKIHSDVAVLKIILIRSQFCLLHAG